MNTAPVLIGVACLILTVPIAIGGAYFFLKSKYGNAVGQQMAPSNFISAALILLVGVGLVSLIFLLGWPDSEKMRTVMWLIIIVSVGIAVIASFRPRSDVSMVVVELEPYHKVPNSIIGAFVGIGNGGES